MAKRNDQREAEELQARAEALERVEGDPEAAALADEAADEAATVVTGGKVSLTFDQLMALMSRAQGGVSHEQIAEIVAKATAQGMAAGADRVKPKELKISETERRSAFNPRGERDYPRPKLKCHMYFGSAPLGSPKEVTTLTHEEIAGLNALSPGHYRVKKTDGSSLVVEVKGQMNSNRQLDRLWILLPEGDENKNSYPTLAEFARQCSEDNRVRPDVA